MPSHFPTNRLTGILKKLKDDGDLSGSITAWKEFSPVEGTYASFPDSLSLPLIKALNAQGITRLYSHQREAMDLIAEGNNVVVITPTASGKTLCYNLPVFERILDDARSRALYLFPTKALAQDQLDEAQSLARLLPKNAAAIKIATYDGDTPSSARAKIRQQANIIISNPDMLHTAILPHHTKWRALFSTLKFVVIDEMHTYRGVFGSHFGNVVQRLSRICRFYGSEPIFIFCSATIANPQEHAQNILRREVGIVSHNGAPAAAKTFVLYNPPVVNYDLGIRQSALIPARKIASALVDNGAQTIVFATSRLNVEVLTKYLRDNFPKNESAEKIAGYRGGYLPSARREIEAGVRAKRILGVVSTNALELGIDIGEIDACVICGYPGSIASTRQQAGRAGRKKSQSLAILIARTNSLDQFIIENPDYFFSASPEHCRINPHNVLILLSHIKCAAFELPFERGEMFGGVDIEEILEYLEELRVLYRSNDVWHWSAEGYPAEKISLRSISSNNVLVLDTSESDEHRPIAEVDWTSALRSVHEGAIYICDGQPYFIEQLDTVTNTAFASKIDFDYFTEAVGQKTIRIERSAAKKYAINALIQHGEVMVTEKVVGYKKLRFYTMENLGYGELDLPALEMQTTAYWFTISAESIGALRFSQSEIASGLCGVAYALRHMAAVLLMSEISDIDVVIGDADGNWFIKPGTGGKIMGVGEDETRAINREDMEPTIFLFDNYPGGIGLSHALFDSHPEMISKIKKVIENCPCHHGCPSCIGPTSGYESATKEAALKIIKLLK